jgi:hypothetical protein
MPGKPELEFPVRGTPGGWKDAWDSPDDANTFRERLEEAARQADEQAEALRPATGKRSQKAKDTHVSKP